ncbi:MAG: N-acetylmuramoyl-L-alanine amidase [Clostridiales bacterium]|nr:N-acetylmuramoyl-L-alanine amidase [Clostridiales bacterium]MCD8117339.1 N-acetylmuramoyl-L-alanine amidase [Oscillospiraceae bacterium]
MFDNVKWWYLLVLIVLLAGVALAQSSDTEAADGAAPAPVMVIDAGHGGADGGAVAADGTLESDLNLDIALRLEALAAFWGVDTVMTRDSAEIEYPAEATTLAAMKRADQYARAALVNSTAGAVLISIHQNNYPAAAPWGIQVFYGSVSGSDALAAVLQENLTGQLCSNTRRLAEPIDSSIYLMKKVNCTAVLVECGFLSNPDDLSQLKTGEYRLELAAVILASYLQYTQGMIT